MRESERENIISGLLDEEEEVEAVEEVQDLHLAGQFLWVVCFKVESLNFAQWGTETIQIPHLVKLH